MGDEEQLRIEVLADVKDALKKLNKIDKTVGKTAKGMGRLTAASKVALAAIAATAIIVGKKAVDAATSFGRAIAEVSTIAGLSAKEMDSLTEQVKDMSVAMGVDARETARGLYQTISAGVTDSADAMKVLAIATNLSIAGLAAQEVVVDVLTTVMNAYGLSVEEVSGASDTLFKTVQLGKVRLEDLAGSLGTVIPIAAVSGIRLEELGAAIAAMTKSGLSAERASTALRASLTAILQPSKKMIAAAEKAGFAIGMQALKGKGLAGVLESLVKLEKSDAEATLKLFENKRALVGMLSLGSDGAREFNDAMDGMATKLGATNNALEKMNASASRQFEMFSAKLNVVLIELGEAILPSLVRGMEELSPAIEDVGETIKDNEDTWVDLAEGMGIAAAAGAGLLGILTDIGGKIGEIGGKAVFSLLRTGLTREVGQRMGGALSLGAAITPEEIAATRAIVNERNATINIGNTYVQTTDPQNRLTGERGFTEEVAAR